MLKAGALQALGAMSGTSLDGVDAAVLDTDGITIFGFGPSAYRPYSPEEQAVLRAALGAWPGDDGVANAAKIIEAAHLQVLAGFEGIDLVGFHGQTLAHDPANRRTHQAGDGAALARGLGLPVVWDFRSNDVALGGQGAPLAPFFHFACAQWMGAKAPVAFLNLGGVGNLTWVNPACTAPEAQGALLAFDTGPANAPINDWVMRCSGAPYDKDGALAAQGRVADGLLERFLAEPYFQRMPPKSLDRDSFATAAAWVHGLSLVDGAATLTAIAAAGVMQAMAHCPEPPVEMLVTGGGRHNPVLMGMLQAGLDCPVRPVEAVGLDGDMLEAQAFAYLAVRVARGLPTSCASTTGVGAAVGGGVLSYPAY